MAIIAKNTGLSYFEINYKADVPGLRRRRFGARVFSFRNDRITPDRKLQGWQKKPLYFHLVEQRAEFTARMCAFVVRNEFNRCELSNLVPRHFPLTLVLPGFRQDLIYSYLCSYKLNEHIEA